MSRTRMLVSIAVVTAIMGLLHRYVWARLVRDPAWPAPWGRALTIAVFVLAALIPLTFVAMRAAPRAWPRT